MLEIECDPWPVIVDNFGKFVVGSHSDPYLDALDIGKRFLEGFVLVVGD